MVTGLFLSVWCSLWMMSVTRGYLFPSFSHLQTDDTVIDVTRYDTLSLSRDHRALDHDSLPHGFKVQFQLNKELVTLNLTRCPHTDVNIPVYERVGSDVIKKNSIQLKNRGIYHDSASGACLLVHVNPHPDDVIRMFGTFYFDNQQYFIQPGHDDVSHDVDTLNRGQKVDVRHVIAPTPRVTVYNSEPLTASDERFAEMLRNERVKRQSVEDYKVELLIVVDHVIYERFFSMTSGTSAQRSTDADALISQYYSYVINEMNLRYGNLSGDIYTIQVLAAGIVISKTQAQSSWTVNNIISSSLSSSSIQIDVSDAIDDFTTWSTNTASLPTRDHTMLFTGYNVSANGNAHSTGIAWLGGICGDASASVVEEGFSFFVATTAAHELGHSLGARHDGSGNQCSSDDNYVMSVLNSISDIPSVTRNLWQFSTCSQSAFTTKINSLNSEGRNCMQNEGSHSHLPDTPVSAAEIYSPDDTCMYALGEGSYVCRSIQTLDEICTVLYCSRPGTSYCTYTLPPEGTSCGSGKWCSSGYCVTSTVAPQIDESCPFGDQPGIVQNGQTCPELIASRPDYCYQSFYQTKCCQSCSDIADLSKPECLYGDQDLTFCSGIDRYNCYFNEALCCSSCAAKKNNTLPGCEFGNRLGGCTSSLCPFYPDECCETCATSTVPTTPTTTPSTTTKSTTPSTTKSTTQSTTPSTTAKSTTPSTTTKSTTPSTTTKSTTPSTTTKSTTSSTTTKSTTPSTTTKSTTPSTTTKSTTPSTSQSTATTNMSSSSTTQSPESTSPPSSSEPTSPAIPDAVFIGVGAGVGVILLIVLGVIMCMLMRRKKSKKARNLGNPADEYDNIGFVPVTSATSPVPRHPPPRRGSTQTSTGNTESQTNLPPEALNNRRGANNNNNYDNADIDGYMTPKDVDLTSVDIKTESSKPSKASQNGPVVYRKPLKPPTISGVPAPTNQSLTDKSLKTAIKPSVHKNQTTNKLLSTALPALDNHQSSELPAKQSTTRPLPAIAPKPKPRNTAVTQNSSTNQHNPSSPGKPKTPLRPTLPVKPNVKTHVDRENVNNGFELNEMT